MSRYINSNGTLAVLGRGEGLKVVITNVSTGAAIQAGALANEEQTEAEYMAMHGFEPLGEVDVTHVNIPSSNVSASDYKVTVTVSDKKHWSVELAEAMEEVVRATDAHTKAAARLTKATAALKRAQTNAENSILGT